jgi:hypothetical protein
MNQEDPPPYQAKTYQKSGGGGKNFFPTQMGEGRHYQLACFSIPLNSINDRIKTYFPRCAFLSYKKQRGNYINYVSHGKGYKNKKVHILNSNIKMSYVKNSN